MTTPTEHHAQPATDDGVTSAREHRHRRRRRAVIAAAVSVAIGVLAVVLVWFQPQTLFIDDVVDEAFPEVPPVAADTEPADGDDGPDTEAADTEAAVADVADDEPAADDFAADDPAADEPAADEPAADEPAADEPAADEPAVDEAPGDDEVGGPELLATGSFSSRNRYTVTGSASTYELADGSRVLRFEDFRSTNGPDLYVYLAAADAADPDAALDADAVDLGLLTGNVGDQNYTIPDDVDLDVHDTVVIWCKRFTVAFGAADLGDAASPS